MKTALSANAKTGVSINWNHNTCKSDCPFGSNGDKSCYGLKGPCSWSTTKRANAARLAMFKANPDEYFSRLKAEIVRKKKPLAYVRVNGNGDTPNKLWVELFALMAKETPTTQYWVATRYPEWWSDVNLPNVVVRYSHGVKANGLSSSVVLDKAESNCPATTGEAANCKGCGYKCWSKDVQHVSYAKH